MYTYARDSGFATFLMTGSSIRHIKQVKHKGVSRQPAGDKISKSAN